MSLRQMLGEPVFHKPYKLTPAELHLVESFAIDYEDIDEFDGRSLERGARDIADDRLQVMMESLMTFQTLARVSGRLTLSDAADDFVFHVRSIISGRKHQREIREKRRRCSVERFHVAKISEWREERRLRRQFPFFSMF